METEKISKIGSPNIKHAYTSTKVGSLADKTACGARQTIYKMLSQKVDSDCLDSIIDVGVTIFFGLPSNLLLILEKSNPNQKKG